MLLNARASGNRKRNPQVVILASTVADGCLAKESQKDIGYNLHHALIQLISPNFESILPDKCIELTIVCNLLASLMWNICSRTTVRRNFDGLLRQAFHY